MQGGGLIFFFDRFLTWLNALGAAIVAGMMVIITANVVGRHLLSRTIPSTLEITEFLLPFPIFLGLAYTQVARSHLRVEVFVSRLPPRLQAALELLAYLVGMLAFALLVWHSWHSAVSSWRHGEIAQGLLPIPLYPSRLTVTVGSGLLALQMLRDMVALMLRLKGKVHHAA